MTHKQHRIILVLVAALALSGAVACVCCPFATDMGVEVSTPAVQHPTEPAGQPTKPPAGQPTKPPAGQPTKPPAEKPTPVPMGSTQIKSYRFIFETASADGSKMNVEGAVTATDMHMKSTTVAPDGSKQEADMYKVGKYLYNKDSSSGQWTKIEVGETQALATIGMFDFNKALKEAQDKGELDMKLVGGGVVRGVPCAKYEFVSKDPDSEGKGFLYLGIADGLIYRMEGESTSTQGTDKVFMEYWDYNKGFSIEPPI